MKYIYTLLFLFCSVFLIAQDISQDKSKNAELPAEENHIKVLEYSSKPQKAVFAEPLKLTFTLPEPAEFDGENIALKDFQVLSLASDKQNPLVIEATVLPLNLSISTLTALSFTTAGGEKLQTEPLEIDIQEMPSKITELIDIRGPFRPFSFLPYMLLIFFAAVIIGIIIYLKKRKKKPAPLPLTPYEKQERPMHEIALSQLDILTQSDLWEKQEYKLYYSEISDIIRQFLAARFNFDAPKMTARELFKKLKTISDFKFDFNILQKFQQSLSLVKFAKAIPTAEERDKALITAKEIILENKETDLSKYQKDINKGGKENEKVN